MKPHEGVYCRLGVSKVCEGIGLFAIIDIPVGTKINRDEFGTILVAEKEVEELPVSIQELYKDFAPLNDGMYECPVSFNLMTPMWYLNHSSRPNIVMKKDYDLVAIRDINAGEELTADYGTYSEIPKGKTV